MRIRVLFALVTALTVMAAALPATASESDLITYEVTITNLAATQPISPPVLATHSTDVRFWRTGHAASEGIVAIAENGDPSVAEAALAGVAGVTDVVNVGQPITTAGSVFGDFTDTVTVTITAHRGDRLSLAGMLICTNDGFVGLDSLPLPNRGTRTAFARAYDAGSEINTERSEDIVDACSLLGPVVLEGDDNGNENDAVDASGVITRHRGIVGESDLLEAHNWPRRPVTVEITPIG